MPGGTYFLYVKAPKGCAACPLASAEVVAQHFISEYSVCCVPWDDAGPFLRFSVTYLASDEKEEDELMDETVERLASLKLRW